MRDVEVPPLSAPVAHFRSEVGGRADRLVRVRRGVTAGVLALVLLVGGLAGVGLAAGGGTVHRSAAPPVPSTSTTTGSATAARPPVPSGAAGNETGRSQDRAAPTTVPPTGPPWSEEHVRRFTDPPNGSTLQVAAGTPITLSLTAPATGSWGGVHVERGLGSVLAPVTPQSGDARGDTTVFLKAVRTGVARLEVPCTGDPSRSWHGTVVVTTRR